MKGAARQPGQFRSRIAGAVLAFLLAPAVPAAAEPSRGASTGEVRVVDAIAPGPSVAERLAEIQLRIARALAYPPIARARGLEGVARVEFEVRQDGEAIRVHVAGSSGHYVLDQAALASVRRAAPLPWVYGRLEVPVRFSLEGGS